MRSVVDPEFQGQRERFVLRHACEDCVFFVAEGGRCANGYPNKMHRAAAFAEDGARDGTFCKEFELL